MRPCAPFRRMACAAHHQAAPNKEPAHAQSARAIMLCFPACLALRMPYAATVSLLCYAHSCTCLSNFIQHPPPVNYSIGSQPGTQTPAGCAMGVLGPQQQNAGNAASAASVAAVSTQRLRRLPPRRVASTPPGRVLCPVMSKRPMRAGAMTLRPCQDCTGAAGGQLSCLQPGP